MQWVDISTFDAAARRAITLVRFTFDGTDVSWEGDVALGARIAADGVFSMQLARQTYPADGEAFLRGLGEEYRSAYFFAGDVNEGRPSPLA